jgi:hypothetical protein
VRIAILAPAGKVEPPWPWAVLFVPVADFGHCSSRALPD